MDAIKKSGLVEQVRRFRARFVQHSGLALSSVLTEQTVKNVVSEETRGWRERLYGPLTTLALFIEQVLGADHSCQDAVARGQAPCSLGAKSGSE